jgi:hypothetical protein
MAVGKQKEYFTIPYVQRQAHDAETQEGLE